MTNNRVLLAADGSEHSYRAAEHAALLAGAPNGEIVIAYVVEPGDSKSDVLHNTNKQDIENKRYKELEKITSFLKTKELPYEVKFLHGTPGPSIVKHANENEYNYVVLGSRGLNNLQSAVLGSVSHKVAKHAQVPVLIVK